MNINIAVRPCDDVERQDYDLAIFALGYERRATHVAKDQSGSLKLRVAIGYNDHPILHYAENRDWYSRKGYVVRECTDSEYRGVVEGFVDGLNDTQKDQLQILVDVSSLNRRRLATLIDIFRTRCSSRPVRVDFAYSLAQFSTPPSSTSLNRHVGPVSPEFAGWWIQPERPCIAIVGLGYEEEKALGSIEHVQPSDVWVFMPRSPIVEYTGALKEANASLLEMMDRSRILEYDVDCPYDLFVKLESLVAGLSARSNCILLPFGPKIFALASLLVASIYSDVAVWRVSGAEEPADRVGHSVYGLSATFTGGAICQHTE